MQVDEKVRENKLRRMAQRQGLQLVKSRRRDPRAIDFGTYALVDPNSTAMIAGDPNSGFGMTLEEVETALTTDS